MSDDSLASYGDRMARPGDRSSSRRRWTVWALVGLIHIAFLILLQMSQFPPDAAHKPTPVETMLMLSFLPSANAPPVNFVRPDQPSASEPVIVTAPITLPPTVPPPAPSTSSDTKNDVLRAVGDALACGAGNYEYLGNDGRSHCRHRPWEGQKAANGTVTLQPTPKPLATAPHISGADQQRRDMETGNSSGCPVIVQGPCLKNLFTGQGEKPF